MQPGRQGHRLVSGAADSSCHVMQQRLARTVTGVLHVMLQHRAGRVWRCIVP